MLLDDIDISKLTIRSKLKLNFKCDECNKIENITYDSYYRRGYKNGIYFCRTCKTKRTNLEKYGVENVSQSDIIKDKKVETYIKNYGVDHPLKSKEVINKIKNNNLEKYGVENTFQVEKFKNQIKETNLEKYGVENVSQSEFIKNKKRKTLLKNYGVDHPLKSEEIKNKVKNTNLKNYGVEWVLKSNKIKDDIKQTNLEKYGVENPMMSKDIQDILKKSIFNKYDKEYYFQTNEFKKKSVETNLEKYGCKHVYQNENYRINNFKMTKDLNYIKYLENNISLFKCDCNKEHSFKISSEIYFHRNKLNVPLCTICYPISDLKSIKEKELIKFIKSIYQGEIISSYRDGIEIDIYLPELNLGFEFNGLYWHSELYKDRNYHLNKTLYFKGRDIKIIHIWEDEWDFKNDIVKSQIKNWLGLTDNRIYARKCRNSQDDTFWNLNRFCNLKNYNIIGGFSKLLRYFLKNYNVKTIISYADRDWSEGDIYKKFGFELKSINKPDYKYIIEGKRMHKSGFKKSDLNIQDKNITEREYMNNLNIYRIYDCGKLKFELNI